MRPLTHDSVCLVSDTERQPTQEMGIERDRERERERERERRKGKNKEETMVGGRKTDGKVERSK